MANVGPLAQGGLDEAFGLAVGAGSVRTGEAVLDAELEAGGAELAGAIAGAVVGEQAADGDTVLGIEGDGGAQEGPLDRLLRGGLVSTTRFSGVARMDYSLLGNNVLKDHSWPIFAPPRLRLPHPPRFLADGHSFR
jgi:hypothetical protein